MPREFSSPSPLTLNPHNGHPVLYPGVAPSIAARSISNYGSMAGHSLTSQFGRKKKVGGKRYRLPLLILLALDWGLIILFSIVVNVSDWLSSTEYWGGKG